MVVDNGIPRIYALGVCQGRYDVMKFGATKEDFRGHMSAIHKNNSRHVEEETYWERRLNRLKARLKAEQELFEHEMTLKKEYESELNEAIAAAKAGLTDSQLPEKPIVGVPASYFLSMLDAGTK